MATTTTSIPRMAATIQRQATTGNTGNMHLEEALLGLLFIAPAAIITIVFNLFPVLYGFFLSMQGGIVLPEGFVGLQHFVRALGSLAYLVGFALVLALIVGSLGLFRAGRERQRKGEGQFWLHLVPSLVAAPSLILLLLMIFFTDYTYLWLSVVGLLVAIAGYVYLSAKDKGGLMLAFNALGAILLMLSGMLLLLFFLRELHSTLQPLYDVISTTLTQALTAPREKKYAQLIPLGQQIAAWLGFFLALVGWIILGRATEYLDESAHATQRSTIGLVRVILLIVIIVLGLFNWTAIDLLNGSINLLGKVEPAQLEAASNLRLAVFVERILYWPHITGVLFGITFIALAYYFWSRANRKESNLGMGLFLLISILLLIGGWLFISELPSAAAGGDPDFYASLNRTVMYAILTVPAQLGLGLLLAYLLFHEVKWGKGLYRTIFFIPYIAPTVATAAVFTILFAGNESGVINSFLHNLGIPAQQWLRDPRGIFEIIAVGGRRGMVGTSVLPSFMVGPSLPLFTAILYSIWVFSGYNCVIFMSGLGTVPKEMYEAAQVDGAGRWISFRHITFPLISPTTFFLTLLSIVGTFRAFNHIYVLRTPSARGAMDVTTVYIYEIIRTVSAPRPYAAALSFILFGIILVLTVLQNRISKDQVFYG